MGGRHPFIVWCLMLLLSVAAAADRHTQVRTLEHGGIKRLYRLHVPNNLGEHPAVVLALHGGGGTAVYMERSGGFDALSDQEGFLVVYPEAVEGQVEGKSGRNWNDGRADPLMYSQLHDIDDVGFIRAILDQLAGEFHTDPGRVYSTGISNGAIMSYRLAIDLSDRIAAIAPVVGGIAQPLKGRFPVANPVSVLIFQGVDDPLVPYGGGPIRLGKRGRDRGRILSTAEAVRLWVETDGCKTPGQIEPVADGDPKDGCSAVRTTYSGGRRGTEVVFYRIDGGGHTWPGGSQYLPVSVVGRVCRDFDASRLIWDFFKAHPR